MNGNTIKFLKIILIIPLIILTIYCVFLLSTKSFKTTAYQEAIIQEQIAEETITLMFVGDVMLDRGVERKIKNDWTFPFLKIKETLDEADLLFGNLESVISDKGRNVGSIYSFRAKPESISGLIYAGFDIISLANNHSFDYTAEALKDTSSRLEEANIDFAGAGYKEKAFSPIIKEVKDIRIAFLAYTNLGPLGWKAGSDYTGLAWINRESFSEISADIKKAKQESDILVVSLHAGDEYSLEPNDFQKDFARLAIDSGADLIIGHHPHIIQPMEKYKNGWIFYSLGNFVFDQQFSESVKKGQIVKVLIKNGKINQVIPINIKINDSFQPEIQKD
ncbi:MAG: CapA family protein [Patescibacteria group bacterium]